MRALSKILAILAASSLHLNAGYTHYFTWQAAPSEAALKQCVAEMNQLIEARKSILVSPDEPGAKPGMLKLQAGAVDFNGVDTNACEPFVFPGHRGFNFCKTAANPYDEVVAACLLVARDHFPPAVLEISSDGSWADWSDGAKLYSSVFKRSARDPMRGSWTSVGLGMPLILAFLVAAVLFWAKKVKRQC